MSQNADVDLKSVIRDFPDFPKPGILFRDITTILKCPETFGNALSQMEDCLKDVDFDLVISPEARGFMLGAPIAYNLKKGFIPARKKGKLPGEIISKTYFLEYGLDSIEIHKDAIKPGQKVVIIDDLLATGGTAKGIIDIVEELGGEVTCVVFLIELSDINGKEILDGYNVKTILKY